MISAKATGVALVFTSCVNGFGHEHLAVEHTHRDVAPGILNWNGDMRLKRNVRRRTQSTAASSDEVTMTVYESQVPIASSASLSWAEADGQDYAPCVGGTDWIGLYCGDEPSAITDANMESWQYVTISSGACDSGKVST